MSVAFRGQKNEVEVRCTAKIVSGSKPNGQLNYEHIRFWLLVDIVPMSELREFADEVQNNDDFTYEDEINFYVQHVKNWRDVVDNKGADVEFSEDNLRAMMEVQGYRDAVANAFTKGNLGEVSRQKN